MLQFAAKLMDKSCPGICNIEGRPALVLITIPIAYSEC
jgi:hypothetical protein